MANGKKKKKRIGSAPVVLDEGYLARSIRGPNYPNELPLPSGESGARRFRSASASEVGPSGVPPWPGNRGSTSATEEFHWHGGRRHPGIVTATAPEGSSAATGISDAARERLRRIWSIPIEPEVSREPGVALAEDLDESDGVEVDREPPVPSEYAAEEHPGGELDLLRSIAAGIERIAASIEAIGESIGQVRDWAATLSARELGERSLGRLVVDAELLVERGIEDAEERARAIVADAREQAERIRRQGSEGESGTRR